LNLLHSEVFELSENNKSQLIEKYRGEEHWVGEVPDDLVECAKTAEGSCPVNAIKVG
jgi:ferredoxin